jgi:hypothetical protein
MEFKCPPFEDTLDKFMEFINSVLRYSPGGNIVVKSSSVIQTAYNGYKNVLSKTKPQSHLKLYKEVYLQCEHKLKTNNLDDFMEWFRDKTNFTISPREKTRNKLLLTTIFRNCCRVSEQLADEAEKNPEALEEPGNLFPENFMLFLLRIFYYCTDDKAVLINHITELEEKLNLDKGSDPDVTDPFNDMVAFASEAASKAGIQMPATMQPSQKKELRKMVSTFIKDKSTQETLRSVLKDVDIRNPKNFPKTIGKLLQKMGEDPEEPEAVKQSMQATSDSI